MRKPWMQREKEVSREAFGGREGSNLAASGSRDGDVEMQDASTSSGDDITGASDRKGDEMGEHQIERTVRRDETSSGAEHASESDSSTHPMPLAIPSASSLPPPPARASLSSIRAASSLYHHQPHPHQHPSPVFPSPHPSVSSDSLMFSMGLLRPSASIVVGSPRVLQGTESLVRKVGSRIGLGIGRGRKFAHLSTSSVVVENNPVASASSVSAGARLESTAPVDSEATMVVDVSSESQTFFKSPLQEVEASPLPTAEPAHASIEPRSVRGSSAEASPMVVAIAGS